ncbi:MAG: cytochrome c3 family protein [Spirochaetia bacterium]
MNDQEKGRVHRRPARIVLYAGVPVVLLALVFAALSIWGDAKAPRALSGLKFNHKFHTEDVGVTCDVCHDPNTSNPRFMNFPNHDTCSACHADDLDASSPDKNCELCHTQPDYKTLVRKDQVLAPLVKFDHPAHQKAGVDCAACHSVFDKNILTGNEMIPTMDTCVTCHADKKIPGGTDCSFCHVQGLENIKPQTHTAAWKTTHGVGLTKDLIDSSCRVCHTKERGNSCTECHHQAPLNFGKTVACATCHGEGFDTTRPADHTPLWVSRHGKGLTQSQIDQRCALCHTKASGNDCESCHRREAPKNHTIGWTENLHGIAARSDRQSCSTCHDQSECISCHTTNEPFTHTGSWGTPFDRHCLSCHVEGGGYVSGSMQGNCGVCHDATDVFAKHQAQSFPSFPPHNTGLDCGVCHNVTNVKHPFPRFNGSSWPCITCHTH